MRLASAAARPSQPHAQAGVCLTLVAAAYPAASLQAPLRCRVPLRFPNLAPGRAPGPCDHNILPFLHTTPLVPSHHPPGAPHLGLPGTASIAASVGLLLLLVALLLLASRLLSAGLGIGAIPPGRRPGLCCATGAEGREGGGGGASSARASPTDQGVTEQPLSQACLYGRAPRPAVARPHPTTPITKGCSSQGSRGLALAAARRPVHRSRAANHRARHTQSHTPPRPARRSPGRLRSHTAVPGRKAQGITHHGPSWCSDLPCGLAQSTRPPAQPPAPQYTPSRERRAVLMQQQGECRRPAVGQHSGMSAMMMAPAAPQ